MSGSPTIVVPDGSDLFDPSEDLARGRSATELAMEEDPGPETKVPPARDAKRKAQFADDDGEDGPEAKVPPARDAKRKAQK